MIRRPLLLVVLAACHTAAPAPQATSPEPRPAPLLPWSSPCRVPMHVVTDELFFDLHEESDEVLETAQEGDQLRFRANGQDVRIGPDGALEVAPGEPGERAVENFRTLVGVWREPPGERQAFFSSEGVRTVTAKREGDERHRKLRLTITEPSELLAIDWFRGTIEENANRIADDDERRTAEQAFTGGEVWVQYEVDFDHGRPTHAVWSRGFAYSVDGAGDSGTWEQRESTLDWAHAEGCAPR